MNELTSEEKYDLAYTKALFLKDKGYFPELTLTELTEILLSNSKIPEFGF